MSAEQPVQDDQRVRILRKRYNLIDPAFGGRNNTDHEEEHPFYRDKALLTKVERHLRQIEVHESNFIQVNGKNLLIFTLSMT